MVVAQRDRQAGLFHAVDQQPRRGALPRFLPHLDNAPALRWVNRLLGQRQKRPAWHIPCAAPQIPAALPVRILLPVPPTLRVGRAGAAIAPCRCTYRSDATTTELHPLMRIYYALYCL